jgi:hypothetical protein
MKKFLIILFLLIIIAGSASYIFLKTSAQDLEKNYFNDNLRYIFARYPMFREILGLHFDGDAKSDFLGTRYKNIIIRVIPMNGLYINNETIAALAEKIQKITGKTTLYVPSQNVPFSTTSTAEELQKNMLSNSYPVTSRDVVLYLLIANQKSESEDQTGSTLRENGIVLFTGTLMKFASGSKDINIEKYQVGILLHEFGHQIGLPHNDLPGCLMNDKTEVGAGAKTSEILDDFCDFEKEQISKMVF